MNKKISLIVGVVLIILAIAIYFVTRPIPLVKPLELKNVLAKNLAENGTGTIIDLKTVGDFDWDELYILSPYRKNIKGLKGQEELLGKINIDPNTCILVFAKGKVVNGFSAIPRDLVDFTLLNENYPKEKARFRLQKRPFNGPGNKPWYNVITF